MREYDQIAEWYVATRNPEIGVADLALVARHLPPEAQVLDLGCGDGIPVSRWLLREGFGVHALDSSAEMVSRYRFRFPGVSVQCGQAQEAEFVAGSFAAVVAWGVLFHLSAADQRAIIEKVSGWLAPGGRFLFTSGDTAGVREGEMNGVVFQYASLGVDGYRAAIERAGMRLESEHCDAWHNHVYIACKTA